MSREHTPTGEVGSSSACHMYRRTRQLYDREKMSVTTYRKESRRRTSGCASYDYAADAFVHSLEPPSADESLGGLQTSLHCIDGKEQQVYSRACETSGL